MAASLRPRRGRRSTAISKGIVLKRGEIFFEVPDTGVGSGVGNIVMGDGITPYGDLPYFAKGQGSGSGTGSVNSVNYILPDSSGNVNINTVPLAEDLVSSDNIENTDNFIFRTSGGTSDVHSGTAELHSIKGKCIQNMSTGEITVANPTAFVATGLNQFNPVNILSDYSINSNGEIIPTIGSYVCFIHTVGGLDNGYVAFSPSASISRIGWFDQVPESTSKIYVTVDTEHITSIVNSTSSSIICFTTTGYICIACTNIDDLVVHPRWSGEADQSTAIYSSSVITIPTHDINNLALPTSIYGFPSIGNVFDEINFDRKTYTKRIGRYEYSASNLAIVEAMGVSFLYDNTNIFYVLDKPIIYNLASDVSGIYTVNDYGTEEFLNTTVEIGATNVYGVNLKDKLRRDVVTISSQKLTENQKNQVRTNIGAVSTIASFTEAEDQDNEKLLNTIISGNPFNTILGAEKRLLRRLSNQVSNNVSSVNSVLPDENGNVVINRVALSDNIYASDNNEVFSKYIHRTSAGGADIESGVAELDYIRGNISITNRVKEVINITASSEHTPEEGEVYTPISAEISGNIWRTSAYGTTSGNYTFIYDSTISAWTDQNTLKTVLLSNLGILVSGDLFTGDKIVVSYTKAEKGNIAFPKPISFTATGLNQFDKNSTNIIPNYTINMTTGLIEASNGSYVCYCKAPYVSDGTGYIAYDSNSTLTGIAYSSVEPSAGKLVDISGSVLTSQLSTCTFDPSDNTGYILISCTDYSGLCIHPRWSGLYDTVYEDYKYDQIVFPTKDINGNSLPLATYGLPALNSIKDELNLGIRQYIKRVEVVNYSDDKLEEIQAMGIDYDYDNTYIVYILPNPITYKLESTISGIYTVNDYGTERFELEANNNVPVYALHLYGQNLKDKLRRDVVTISQQNLTDTQKAQIRTNIGAINVADLNGHKVKLLTQTEYEALSEKDPNVIYFIAES